MSSYRLSVPEKGMNYVHLDTDELWLKSDGSERKPIVRIQWWTEIREGETMEDAVIRTARALIATLEN